MPKKNFCILKSRLLAMAAFSFLNQQLS